MTARPRVLVVGAGAIARRVHLPNLAAHADRPELVVLDVDRTVADRAAAQFGARTADLDAPWPDADLAVICAPASAHAALAVRALSSGMSVACEKPLATTAADAQRIAAAARAAGRAVLPCYTNRYRDDIQALADVIAKGRLGRVRHISASWTRRAGVPGTRGGLEQGVLWDLGSHLVDLALLLTGWRGDVTAFATADAHDVADLTGGTPHPDSASWYGPAEPVVEDRDKTTLPTPAGDTVSGLARIGDGTLNLLASWSYHGRGDEVVLRVAGTGGVAELRTVFGFSPDRLTIAGPCLRLTGPRPGRWTVLIREQSREPVEYRRQTDLALAAAARPADPADPGLALAVRSVSLCEAFDRALTAGTSVTTRLSEANPC